MLIERRNNACTFDCWEATKTVVSCSPIVGLFVAFYKGYYVASELRNISAALKKIEKQNQPLGELTRLFLEKVDLIKKAIQHNNTLHASNNSITISYPSHAIQKPSLGKIDVSSLESRVKELEENAKEFGDNPIDNAMRQSVQTARQTLEFLRQLDLEKKDLHQEENTLIQIGEKIEKDTLSLFERQKPFLKQAIRCVSRLIDSEKNCVISCLISAALFIAELALRVFAWTTVLGVVTLLWGAYEISNQIEQQQQIKHKTETVFLRVCTELVFLESNEKTN